MELSPPPLRVLLALGLVSACVLALQVVFTRLLSAVLAYHFSFLAISLALLGTGTGALLVYMRPGWFEGASLERVLARWTAAYALLLFVLPLVVVHLDFDDSDGLTVKFAANVAAACVLAAVPSLAAGVVVALAMRGYSNVIGRVYAFDLVGAALGALAVVPLLRWPAPDLIVVLGAVAALAAVMFAGPAAKERVAGIGVIGVGVVLLFVAAASSVLHLPGLQGRDSIQVTDRWGPLARVQAWSFPGAPTPHTPSGAVFYDRVYAPVYGSVDGQLPSWEGMLTGPQSIAFVLRRDANALVIGGGGGRDIYTALSSGARHVDVIELNGIIRDAVDKDLAQRSGRPYSRTRVSTSIGDGRSVLAARDTKYDVIHIGFTDTLSANAAAGFALSENNLYTTEAFQEYFDHLTDGGVLSVSRLDKLVGDEAMRATILTLGALQKRGIADPERNIVVVRGRDFFGGTFETILARLKPFTREDVTRIGALADDRGLGITFAAGGPYQDAWKDLAAAKNWQEFCHSYRLDVCPPTDDKPFFFNMRRLSEVGSARPAGYAYSVDPTDLLMLTLGVLAVLSVIGFLLPLPFGPGAGGRPSLTSLVYFVAIGLGYLVLEIVLVQRFVLFLGYPTYALSVVLFSLLLFTGLGSYLSSRFSRSRALLTGALVAAVALIAVSAFGLQWLLRSLIDLPFAARVIVSIAIIAPFGVLLGVPMPVGLQRLQQLHPHGVPWAWGVNGIASVLASVLGVAVAIFYGFAVASLVAAACYAFALGHALIGRWPAAAPPP